MKVVIPAARHSPISARERGFGLLIVHPQPALDRHRNIDRRPHRARAFGHQRRLAHQAGAEAPRLHAVRGAADIEVDLVIAEICADLRRLGQPRRLGPAKLQRHGMLGRIEANEPRPVAADHGLGRHHLGVEQGMGRQRPMEDAGNAGPSTPSSGRRKIGG